jgi:hypothetical protein
MFYKPPVSGLQDLCSSLRQMRGEEQKGMDLRLQFSGGPRTTLDQIRRSFGSEQSCSWASESLFYAV